MSMYAAPSTQQPAAICTLKSPVDAIHILEAVRLGLVPRVTRRLTGHERSMIRPGTVWVWEEEETNMRRWTDGRRWGASRVGGGGFLVYTETTDSLSPPPSADSSSGSAYNSPTYSIHGQNGGYTPVASSSKKSESLIKQTYSTTMTHPVTGKVKKFHVVGYASKHNPQGDALNPLPLPHQLPLLANLKITPGIWPEWEQRRESDVIGGRPMSGRPLPSTSRSAPATALPSPDGLSTINLGPPTSFPPNRRPPTPGREAFPPARQYGQDFAPSPAPNEMPHLTTPYNQPFYPPPSHHDPYESQRQMYAGRAMSQPSSYPPQHPTPTQQTQDRYHPYQAPTRPNRPSPYPASGASMSSSGPMSSHSSSQQSFYDGDRARDLRERDGYEAHQPAPTHPYQPYSYPSNPPQYPQHPSGLINQQRASQQYPNGYHVPQHSGPEPYYRDIMRPSENSYRDHLPEGHYPDPRRVSSDQQYRPQSNPQQFRQDHLQPPRSGNSAATSPKMSIPSALLNPDSVISGGLTLPPLRLAIDDSQYRGPSRNASPQQGKISPRSASDSGSASSQGMDGRGWREESRQLGELGNRVSI